MFPTCCEHSTLPGKLGFAFLLTSPSIPPRRLRDLEVHCADSEGGLAREGLQYGTWGAELHPGFEPQPDDVVAHEHWCSSGLANTDLDQQLKTRGIHRLIVIGLITNTCVEATVRFGAELGYDVTVVRDATASYSEEDMHATLDINLPNYANAIVTTRELLESISASQTTRPARSPMLSTDSITREPGLLGQTVVVIGGSAGIGLRPRDTPGPQAPRCSSRLATPSASAMRSRSPKVRRQGQTRRHAADHRWHRVNLIVHVMVNTSVTGATYDIDGGQQFVA